MGVNADKWGPGAWRFLHYVTILFPDNAKGGQKRSYSALFHLLPKILPCSICRKHLRKAYKKMPPRLGSRAAMIRWLEDIHTSINIMLKKKTLRVPVRSQLASFRNGWKVGLRDLAFSIAFNLPRTTLSNDVVRFLTACRHIVGKSHMPGVTHLKSKAGLLNTLTHFFRKSKRRVQAKYKPWLTSRSLASSNRVWPLLGKPSESGKSGKRKLRTSRRRVVQVKIGL